MKLLFILACLLAAAVTGFRPSTIHTKPLSLTLTLTAPLHASASTANSYKKPTSVTTVTAAPRTRFQKFKQRAAAFALATIAWRSPALAARAKFTVAPEKETPVAAKFVALGAAGAGIVVGYRALPTSSWKSRRSKEEEEEEDQAGEEEVQVEEIPATFITDKPDDSARLIAQKGVKEILARINKAQNRAPSTVAVQEMSPMVMPEEPVMVELSPIDGAPVAVVMPKPPVAVSPVTVVPSANQREPQLWDVVIAPDSPKEAALKAKYAAIEDLGERCFTILVDLGYAGKENYEGGREDEYDEEDQSWLINR